MRLFTALELPPEIASGAEQTMLELQPAGAISWSPLSNLHITTKFIGAWPEGRLEEIDEALERLTARAQIQIEMKALGWFPNSEAPRVLFAGVEGGSALMDLARDTEEALFRCGVARDKHGFTPHVTLARIRDGVSPGALRAKVEELRGRPMGRFAAPGFHLYRSEPGAGASIYRKIRSYAFERQS